MRVSRGTVLFDTIHSEREIHNIMKKKSLLILICLFLLCACGKQPPAETTGTQPVTTVAETTTVAPETTTAVPETTTIIPETTTPIPETTTTAAETTTAAPETTTAIPETTTAAPETTPAVPEDQALIRRRGGEPGGEIIDMIPLPEMPYERPDMEGLMADMDALAKQVETATDVPTIVKVYKDIRERMTHVQTMYALAEYRNHLDFTDSFYSAEVEYLSAQNVEMNYKHNELLVAFANSSLRAGLERAYFGRRYFDYNAKEQKDETYLELTRLEEELCDQYREMTAAPAVTYQGETKSLNEWLEAESEEVRDGAEAAYLQAYHEPLARLYLELVRVRQQIAHAVGYDNYLSYAFKGIYYRDYSPARAREFFERVQTYLVPVLETLYELNPNLHQIDFPASLREDPLGQLAAAAEAMGGIVWDAYRFMDAYDLCDVEASPTKREGGYTDYLRAYEVPFFFLNPASDSSGRGTAHEFGHFIDVYRNYRQSGPNEISEAISTAMEYLAIAYNSSLNQEEREAGLRAILLYKLLFNVGRQCALADFEAQIYEKNPEELTPEDLDEMYYQCRQAYGLKDSYPADVQRGAWITVEHFFEYPEYVLSYSVANIISLQIIRLEMQNPGAGLEAFCRLLERSPWAGVDIIAKNAKLQSPFASATLEQLAEFFKETLELP